MGDTDPLPFLPPIPASFSIYDLLTGDSVGLTGQVVREFASGKIRLMLKVRATNSQSAPARSGSTSSTSLSFDGTMFSSNRESSSLSVVSAIQELGARNPPRPSRPNPPPTEHANDEEESDMVSIQNGLLLRTQSLSWGPPPATPRDNTTRSGLSQTSTVRPEVFGLDSTSLGSSSQSLLPLPRVTEPEGFLLLSSWITQGGIGMMWPEQSQSIVQARESAIRSTINPEPHNRFQSEHANRNEDEISEH